VSQFALDAYSIPKFSSPALRRRPGDKMSTFRYRGSSSNFISRHMREAWQRLNALQARSMKIRARLLPLSLSTTLQYPVASKMKECTDTLGASSCAGKPCTSIFTSQPLQRDTTHKTSMTGNDFLIRNQTSNINKSDHICLPPISTKR